MGSHTNPLSVCHQGIFRYDISTIKVYVFSVLEGLLKGTQKGMAIHIHNLSYNLQCISQYWKI